jgi:hypothetical protein
MEIFTFPAFLSVACGAEGFVRTVEVFLDLREQLSSAFGHSVPRLLRERLTDLSSLVKAQYGRIRI